MIFFEHKKGIKLPLAAKVAAVRGGAPGKASGIPRWNVPLHYNESWEGVIVSGLYDAFNKDEELKQEHLDSVITTMIPLSQTMEEQIKGIRDWAKLRARRASTAKWEYESGPVRQLEM